MWTDAAIGVLAPITVPAEDLKSRRKLLASQPREKGAAAPSNGLLQFSPVRCAVVLDMINRQEHWLSLATARTHVAAVGVERLVTTHCASPCLVSQAVLTLPSNDVLTSAGRVLPTPLRNARIVRLPIHRSLFAGVVSVARPTIGVKLTARIPVKLAVRFRLLTSWTALHRDPAWLLIV
jgi:hypothetical protein